MLQSLGVSEVGLTLGRSELALNIVPSASLLQEENTEKLSVLGRVLQCVARVNVIISAALGHSIRRLKRWWRPL